MNGRVLSGEADAAADHGGIPRDILAADDGPAGVRPQQGGQDSHQGRFSCAVRAEQAEDRAGGNAQIDPLEGGHIAERLGEPFGLDSGARGAHRYARKLAHGPSPSALAAALTSAR